MGHPKKMNEPTVEEVIEPVQNFIKATLKPHLESTMLMQCHIETELKD